MLVNSTEVWTQLWLKRITRGSSYYAVEITKLIKNVPSILKEMPDYHHLVKRLTNFKYAFLENLLI